MPHAEYEVYSPRSNATISSSLVSGTRRRACAAAVMPPASPPTTTRRRVTARSRACRCPQAAELRDHGLGRRAELVDRAGSLPGRVALPVGVDAGGEIATGEMQRALFDRLEQLIG